MHRYIYTGGLKFDKKLSRDNQQGLASISHWDKTPGDFIGPVAVFHRHCDSAISRFQPQSLCFHRLSGWAAPDADPVASTRQISAQWAYLLGSGRDKWGYDWSLSRESLACWSLDWFNLSYHRNTVDLLGDIRICFISPLSTGAVIELLSTDLLLSHIFLANGLGRVPLSLYSYALPASWHCRYLCAFRAFRQPLYLPNPFLHMRYGKSKRS